MSESFKDSGCGQLREIRLEEEFHALPCAGKRHASHDHGKQEEEEKRHQNLRPFFNTLLNAADEHRSAKDHEHQEADQHAPRGFGEEAKRIGGGIDIAVVQVSGEGAVGVVKHPAADNGIV